MTSSLPSLSLIDALNQRHSVRGYLDRPVPAETLERIFSLAQQAPSNCNTQPWQVFVASGKTRDTLREAFLERFDRGVQGTSDFHYDPTFHGPYRDRQVACAVALYNEMGIGRGDKPGRLRALRRNFELFDAPHIAFIGMDRAFGETIALDVGIYLQSLMLTLRAFGIASCAMGSMRSYPDLVRDAFDLDESVGILVGVAFGYEDPADPANRTRTVREPLPSAVSFRD